MNMEPHFWRVWLREFCRADYLADLAFADLQKVVRLAAMRAGMHVSVSPTEEFLRKS
jgi:hypothetical protein